MSYRNGIRSGAEPGQRKSEAVSKENGLTRKRIEGLYQRAMDLRDSTPTPNLGAAQLDAIETEYSRAYLRAYKTGNVGEFVNATRKYRKIIRSASYVTEDGKEPRK